jgi:asparagine synthase (glutamine-hydrolysing)
MNQALEHRGPDDQSVYMDDCVTLGHRRLSIIDLSPAGRQPKCNEDESIWIVFNGEIYNFQELRADLEKDGHIFTSNTDTEVIIHAYEKWGIGCVEKFNGMWAFALYDKNKGFLFLSRDRFGVKPLYFSRNKMGLIFSSEIKGILQHPERRAAHDKIVYDFLILGFVDHLSQTFFDGIERIMPGESMIYDLDQDTMKKIKWYDLSDHSALNKNIGEDEATERIRELLIDSVRYRLISDVPVGSCLSGGIDSSSLVYAMRKLKADAEINTFSLVFPGKKIDESEYINVVVAATNVVSHSVSPTSDDLLKELNDLIWTQEEPFGSLSIYGQYKVMELANKARIKVLLDGQGSDEIFAGYFIYYKYYLFETLFDLHIDEFNRTLKVMKNKINDVLLFPAMTLLSNLGFSQGFLKNLWLRKMKYLKGFEDFETANPLVDRGFLLNKALFSDMTKYSIPQLLRYEDKNSMRWSIESRVPFLDYRIVELVMSLPSCYKINRGVTKYILRKALNGLVSDRILKRKDKIAFATPEEDWLMEAGFAAYAKEIFESDRFISRRYWKQKEVLNLLDEHLGCNGKIKKNHMDALWRIINVELWMRSFIDCDISRSDITKGE